VPGTVATLESLVAESFSDRSFTLMVIGAFAFFSLVLAGVGIYGVVSFTLSTQTREIGIRLALGAGPGRIRRRTFLRSARVVAAGAVSGVLLALVLGGVMESLLFGVSPRDPLTLSTAPLVLLAAAALAIWIPVVRYTRVDPTVAMRAE
jgi:ABC-type antimicrobial peptide transport system permease subunit